MERYTTLGQSTLNGAYTSGGASMTMTSAASFPTAGNFRIRVDDEILKVTAVAGAVFTVTGAQEGTSASNHSSGAVVKEVLTASALDAIRADASQIGAIASLPSSGNRTQGDIYHTSDGYYRYVFNGSAWVPFYGDLQMTEPVSGDFAWINQGSATISTANGGVYLAAPANAAQSVKIRKKTAPSTPYTIRAAFRPHLHAIGNHRAGLCFRESGTSKLVMWTLHPADNGLYRDHYTNETTFSSTDYNNANLLIVKQPLVWLYIRHSGSTLYFGYSHDGLNWHELSTSGQTTFFTTGPDEVGFFVNPENGSYGCGMTLLHWQELAS